MKIGELAQQSHCSTETIRYYEKIGLLSPRSAGSIITGDIPRHMPSDYASYVIAGA